jgi:DNA modification methylase
MKSMPDKSVDAVITDPPWNVGKDYGTYKDNLSYSEYTELIKKLRGEWERIANNRVSIVLGSEILKQWWDEYSEAKIIIVKLGAIVLTRKNNMHLQWRAILSTCMSNDFATDLWEDIRWPGEGYFFNEPRYGHPAMTPLKLMKRLVNLFTQPGDTVFEPFMGSGTTGVACAQLGRNFIGCEIDPTYYAIAEKRIKQAQMQLLLPLDIERSSPMK